jgi:predicted metal-dependent hydrolase
VRRFAGKQKLPGGLRDYRANKESARAFIHTRLRYFNAHYAFTYHGVSVRDSRTRWGSCSRKGDLNFSYKLLHLPIRLADYVIVHELAHLRHFDHSPAFWATVAETIPDFAARRRELRAFVH